MSLCPGAACPEEAPLVISRNGHQKTVSRVEAPPARSKTELHRGDQKPPCLPVLADAIPAALRELPQWVAWCYVRRGKPGVRRWTKNPIDPRTGRSAS